MYFSACSISSPHYSINGFTITVICSSRSPLSPPQPPRRSFTFTHSSSSPSCPSNLSFALSLSLSFKLQSFCHSVVSIWSRTATRLDGGMACVGMCMCVCMLMDESVTRLWVYACACVCVRESERGRKRLVRLQRHLFFFLQSLCYCGAISWQGSTTALTSSYSRSRRDWPGFNTISIQSTPKGPSKNMKIQKTWRRNAIHRLKKQTKKKHLI